MALEHLFCYSARVWLRLTRVIVNVYKRGATEQEKNKILPEMAAINRVFSRGDINLLLSRLKNGFPGSKHVKLCSYDSGK